MFLARSGHVAGQKRPQNLDIDCRFVAARSWTRSWLLSKWAMLAAAYALVHGSYFPANAAETRPNEIGAADATEANVGTDNVGAGEADVKEALADKSSLELFERQVHPILAASCFPCHGPDEQSNGLRIDSRESLLQGGDSGPAIVVGSPHESRLMWAVRREGELKMPPDESLLPEQIAALEQWIGLGAPWPEIWAPPDDKSVSSGPSPAALRRERAAQSHWAFQPLASPTVPHMGGRQGGQATGNQATGGQATGGTVTGGTAVDPGSGPHVDPAEGAIDAFIAARLAEADLTAAPPATRRELIRRVTLDLTGLLPSSEEVAAFEQNEDPAAYERLVDRLLASPAYGEQWARHWLDVARYSDAKGYVYAREERFWVHAWAYRDWVVQALNDDMPYDRFLLLQIAADQVAPDDPPSWAAMGFLTIGRRFLGVKHDIIDDRIDVVTRGAMGLTVGCARCHDHKYDPVSTRDYYALYGVFQNCIEQRMAVVRPGPTNELPTDFTQELAQREAAYREALAKRRAESDVRARRRVTEYLQAQMALDDYPDEAFSQILTEDDLLPAIVRRWQFYLERAALRNDPIFVPWHAFAAIPPGEFAAQAKVVAQALRNRPVGEIHPWVADQFVDPPSSMLNVAERYGKLLEQVDRLWNAELQRAADENRVPPERLADAAAEALRGVLYGAGAPCEIPDETLATTEFMYPTSHAEELWKLLAKVDRWLIESPVSMPVALRLADRDDVYEARIFRRGNSATPGDYAPRHLPEFLAAYQPTPELRGSGRLDLAEAIIDPDNPLTARVIVNRVWMHHFGAALVRTPSDFGLRAEAPSHPELLDWLARRLIDEGWRLKPLHRRIVLSDAYRRSVRGPTDPEARGQALRVDPDNRLLWRMKVRRLGFEELRDNMLRASGDLDLRVGGKPGDLFDVGNRRRSLYGLIDRQFLPSTLRIFDFANPDLHVPQRSQTSVPQQALFFLNNPWMLERARRLAERVQEAETPEQRVQQMFAAAFQRSATPSQVEQALALVREAEQEPTASDASRLAPWGQLAHMLLSTNEFLFVD